MNDNLSQLKNWLIDIVGQKLVSVCAVVYVYEGTSDPDQPQVVNLQFHESSDGCLRCSGDGESLEFGLGTVSEADLGEYGKHVVRDLSEHAFWKEYVDKYVSNTYSIRAQDLSTFGVRIVFGSERTLDIANIGDELLICKQLPEKIADEEHASFEEVGSEEL